MKPENSRVSSSKTDPIDDGAETIRDCDCEEDAGLLGYLSSFHSLSKQGGGFRSSGMLVSGLVLPQVGLPLLELQHSVLILFG